MKIETALSQKRDRSYQNATAHRYALGQAVRLKGVVGRSAQAYSDTTYRVVGKLPTDGSSLQYRVQSDNEQFARIANELNLEAANDDMAVFA